MTQARAHQTIDLLPAFTQFFRAIEHASADLADALSGMASSPAVASLDGVYLGSFQQQIVDLPAIRTDAGITPREIMRLLGREDEPNVRNALNGLKSRNIAELIPGVSPQRWRLLSTYREQS